MGKCKCLEKYHDYFYLVFSVLVGLMFFLHGWGKLFGESPAALVSLMGVAGVVELVSGAAIALGFFTRLAGGLGAVTMLVAFFKVHASGGFNPLTNGGELAVMYFVAFLVIMEHGARKWSLEQKILKKEVF